MVVLQITLFFFCLPHYCKILLTLLLFITIYLLSITHIFREIEDPKDVISVITDNNLKDFCSQFCLSVFNRRRKPGPLSMPSVQEPATLRCSMCKKSDTVRDMTDNHWFD